MLYYNNKNASILAWKVIDKKALGIEIYGANFIIYPTKYKIKQTWMFIFACIDNRWKQTKVYIKLNAFTVYKM